MRLGLRRLLVIARARTDVTTSRKRSVGKRRGAGLTNEQEGVEDEKVADGKGRETRVAVAEDDHDHPCGAEVCLRGRESQ